MPDCPRCDELAQKLEQTEEALTLEQERSESFDQQADTLMAERDVARRERDAFYEKLTTDIDTLRDQVAHLTEERDAALAKLFFDALAAVSVVPDPPTHAADCDLNEPARLAAQGLPVTDIVRHCTCSYTDKDAK